MYRIGNGYDVHKLVEGRKLILCGVEIQHTKGVLGHSDGDVGIHAIMDALIGALALGDIGSHFPDNDSTYKDIDSKILLKKVMEIIKNKGYNVINVDCSIVLQQPKIRSYIDSMRSTLSQVMEIPVENISVKATTEEKLGFTGDESGVKSYAVVLLKKINE
ncbi:2-C-methyl-D-erythritol 2,4-cyclodiphosphate synthase [Fusobacterium sp. PH5-44]|uniref:2-C-methyl-D-erythritol 2,4-cyclodiphosphate synthase n=1 Tax=unclassified Fusobacterium TaxID=2648384 RepID=UPI003D1B3CF7